MFNDQDSLKIEQTVSKGCEFPADTGIGSEVK